MKKSLLVASLVLATLTGAAWAAPVPGGTIPEPTSLALVGLGLAALAASRSSRHRKAP